MSVKLGENVVRGNAVRRNVVWGNVVWGNVVWGNVVWGKGVRGIAVVSLLDHVESSKLFKKLPPNTLAEFDLTNLGS
jgi:ribosomal protein L35AE/L33A